MMNTVGTKTMIALSALMLSAAAGADTISLRSSVRLNGNESNIKLSDIADLQGPAALALGDVRIADLPARPEVFEIPLRDVRTKLDEAGVHWGKLNLNGRSVVIRPARDSATMPPLAMKSVSIDGGAAPRPPREARDERIAGELLNEATVRGTIANLIVNNLHSKPGDLKLAFDSDDAPLLDTPITSARFEVQPLSSFSSDRIDLTVRTWDQATVQQTRTVSVVPLMRVEVAVLRNDVNSDQVISDADVAQQNQWLPPSQASQVVSRIEAIGRVAGKSMKAGEPLREKHVRRQTLIKRGDLCTVRCLVGGAVISLQAEARADGGEGEQIEFRKQGERDTFLATVSARGEAVLDLTHR